MMAVRMMAATTSGGSAFISGSAGRRLLEKQRRPTDGPRSAAEDRYDDGSSRMASIRRLGGVRGPCHMCPCQVRSYLLVYVSVEQ